MGAALKPISKPVVARDVFVQWISFGGGNDLSKNFPDRIVIQFPCDTNPDFHSRGCQLAKSFRYDELSFGDNLADNFAGGFDVVDKSDTLPRQEVHRLDIPAGVNVWRKTHKPK